MKNKNKAARPTVRSDELDVVLGAPVDVSELISKLEFSEEHLVQAAREQASLFMGAARYRVVAMRRRLKADASYDEVMARKGMSLRKMKQSLDKDEKSTLTESAIRDQITRDLDVIQARRELDRLRVNEEYAKLLLDAYWQRKDACRILADVLQGETNAELRIMRSAETVEQMQRVRREVASKYPGRGGDDE